MRVPIKFIVLVGLYISVRGREDGHSSSDPIAREISEILEISEKCNVIIASYDPLEHLERNDYVPVILYVHSWCIKNRNLCLSKQIRQMRLTHRCTQIIVSVTDRITFVKEWNSHEKDDEHEPKFSFVSELWKAGIQFTSSYDDVNYYLLSRPPEHYNYRDLLISSFPSKSRSLNLFAINVDIGIPSKYYFLCQFCDKLCDDLSPIVIPRETFFNENLRSEFIKRDRLEKLTSQLDDKHMKMLDKSLSEGEWPNVPETLHRKSSGVNLQRLELLKDLFVAAILFEQSNRTFQFQRSHCRVSRLSIDHLSSRVNPRVPGNKVIWSGSSSFTFLTCHTEEGGINFDTYLAPFDLSAWIGIMVAALVTHFAFATFAWHGNIRPIFHFSFSHLILSWLLSFSYSPSKSISKHFWYRVISIAWFFASFVLCMLYTSYAITGVTMPLPRGNISTFKELTNFRVCKDAQNQCTEDEFHDFMQINGLKDEGWKFDFYSTPVFQANLSVVSFEGTHFGKEIFELKQIYNNTKNDTFWKGIHLTDFANSMLPLVFRETKVATVNEKQPKDTLLAILSEMEAEIVKCDRKVYADRTQSVLEEHNYLSKNYNWLKFQVSQERELWSHYYLVFENEFGSEMSKTYNALLEAGIVGHIEKSYRNVVEQRRLKHTLKNKQTFAEKDKSEFKPSSMTGNIQTLFYLFCLMCALSIVVFIVEVTWIPATLTVIRWVHIMEIYMNVALISLEVFVLRLRYPRNRR
jgi:hypothetical protein